MGTIKDRYSKDLIEVEEIKNRCKNTQKNYTKKGLHEPDNHNAMVTHLEPDIQECEVKWVLRDITMKKLVEVMEFQMKSFIF